MRKILFLDIDGVCNCVTSFQAKGNPFPLDEGMCWLVNKISLETGCDIVISSSWRHMPDGMEIIKKKFNNVIDRTGSEGRWRGDEIKAWLDRNPDVTRYAILDDSCDMLVEQASNFFATRWAEGLTGEIAEAVINHLNGGVRIKCARCGNPIHVDHFAGAKMGENGEELYCDNLICVFQLSKDTE